MKSIPAPERSGSGAPTPPELGGIRFDRPRLTDGDPMWRLARSSPHIDANTPYFYLLWCRDFAASSAVARDGADLCAYTAGFVRPARPDTLFVWQTAVASAWQSVGLARRMLDLLVADRYRYVECSITADNPASDRYVRAFARSRGAPVRCEPFLGPEHFGGAAHAPEILYRIGPLGPSGSPGSPGPLGP
ncbi:diaminobutyrate acetyltransferase [Streptomyces sp. NPDC090127]|uniref:diaminobutyrate acetyltransferase n=1 Tax=Streptomyces sp. NPDC090127 TaxID=3365953 RepID=UPI0037F12699